MLTTVIIIFREVLEAAILISLLMVLHLQFHFYRYWLGIAILTGIGGAFLYANTFVDISAWADGSGQEIVNAFSLLCVGTCLAMQLLLSARCYRGTLDNSRLSSRFPIGALTLSATIIMTMAIAREGSEIIVYYSGITEQQRHSNSMIIGGIIGGGLGICIGVLFFTILYQLAIRNLMLVSSLLLVLITAGVMMEATQYFIQAGWILTDEPLWDTSSFLSESSITGQLLYAVFAYEASPTLEEVMAWCLTAGLLGSGLVIIRKKLSAG